MDPSDIEQQNFLESDDPSRKQQELIAGENTTIVVVRWENYKMPIPLNHAKFMRKVFLTLILQLLVTAGLDFFICSKFINRLLCF